jgi:hypothetical protein
LAIIKKRIPKLAFRHRSHGGDATVETVNAFEKQRRRISMRKILVGENVSLDGVMEAPERWSFTFQNAETGKVIADQMSRCDALLLGRVTYQTL